MLHGEWPMPCTRSALPLPYSPGTYFLIILFYRLRSGSRITDIRWRNLDLTVKRLRCRHWQLLVVFLYLYWYVTVRDVPVRLLSTSTHLITALLSVITLQPSQAQQHTTQYTTVWWTLPPYTQVIVPLSILSTISTLPPSLRLTALPLYRQQYMTLISLTLTSHQLCPHLPACRAPCIQAVTCPASPRTIHN